MSNVEEGLKKLSLANMPDGVADHDWIKSKIPHRDPSLLLDGVSSFSREEKSLTAFRFLLPSSPEFQGHVPGNPILPLNRVTEMSNLAAALLMKCLYPDMHGLPVSAGYDGVRQRKIIQPPMILFIKVKFIRRMIGGIYIFSASAENDEDEVVATHKKLLGASMPFGL